MVPKGQVATEGTMVRLRAKNEIAQTKDRRKQACPWAFFCGVLRVGKSHIAAALYNNFTCFFPTVYPGHCQSWISLMHLKDLRRGHLC
jgi:hypothetical protein